MINNAFACNSQPIPLLKTMKIMDLVQIWPDFALRELIIMTWHPKDPRQQSSKVEKSKVLGLSYPKHQKLLKNSFWAGSYVDFRNHFFLA